MTKTTDTCGESTLYKALDTLLYLLAGSAMIVLSLSFLVWLRF